MSLMEVSPDKRILLMDKKPFFYLADTVWCASTNAEHTEWLEYLEFRKNQGFNALQINILPQHDRSDMAMAVPPFELQADGRYDLSRPLDAYFEMVRTKIAQARERSFLPVLSLFWFDWAQDRWTRDKPHRPFTTAEFSRYLDYVIPRFSEFDPIFQCGGDVNFDQWPEHPRELYHQALKRCKELAPSCLTAMHLGRAFLPDELQRSPYLDLSIYQSGHQRNEEHVPWRLANDCINREPHRPVINSEPSYEGLYFGGEYGRWGRASVRRACWTSLLSGASAGVTYGAHGLWSWHKKGAPFYGQSFAGEPFPWRTALHFPGANDFAFAKDIFEKKSLLGVMPWQEILEHRSHEIRVAANPDHGRIAVYLPFNDSFSLRGDFKGWKWETWSLEGRQPFTPDVTVGPDKASFAMHDFNSDSVMVGER